MTLNDYNWRNGGRITTQQFLIGLSINYISSNKNKYRQAFELGEHKLIKTIYSELYNIDLHDPDTFYCYERAIKLGRRSRSPYNQNWTPELMYS